MSGNWQAWPPSPQHRQRNSYDQRYEQQPGFQNGDKIPKTPDTPQNYTIATGTPPGYNYIPEARAPLSPPFSSSPPSAGGYIQSYRYTPPNHQPTINNFSPTNPSYGGHAPLLHDPRGFSNITPPYYPPNDLPTAFQRPLFPDIRSQPQGYHPTRLRLHQSPTGNPAMQIYDTQHAMRPLSETDSPRDENKGKLDPKYKRPAKSKKFFTTGKVFLTLWSQPAGEVEDDGRTVITDGYSAGSFGETVFSKVRRFVVVREGDKACSALPIVTYGRQGVGKSGVVKSEHAIIHTGKKAPDPVPDEYPRRGGERGMLPQPIRVDPDEPDTQLDPMSRIDFARLYTIEHNIKVRSFGMVNRASMQPLLYQFRTVWQKYFGDSGPGVQAGPSQIPSSMTVETSASISTPELVAAYKALRACGLDDEQARATLRKAGLDLSSLEGEEGVVNEVGATHTASNSIA